MARESFRPTPRPRGNLIDLPTAGFPDRATVDLDNKDPSAFTVIETTPANEPDADAETTSEPNDDGGDAAVESPGVGTQVDPASVQKRIHRLKAETHSERRAREAAEARAMAAEQAVAARDAEVADLRRRLEGGTAALAASMKQDRENRLADAERRLAQAHADGDSNAIAKATSDISQAHAELTQIAARTPRPQAEQPQAQPAPQPQRQAPNIAPAALAWIAHNDGWWNKDPVKTKVALSVHEAVVARGIPPSSPEYTRELDKGMKAMYPDHIAYGRQDAGSDARDPTPRRTNVVADGSRETGRVTNPNLVELTSSELAIAKQLNLSPQQYAASKAKLARGTA